METNEKSPQKRAARAQNESENLQQRIYAVAFACASKQCSTLKTVEWILTKPYYGLNNFY